MEAKKQKKIRWKLIRTIGNCRLNGYAFDLFESNAGNAVIRIEKDYEYVGRKNWLYFDSVEEANNCVDNIAIDCDGDQIYGTERVYALMQRWVFDDYC